MGRPEDKDDDLTLVWERLEQGRRAWERLTLEEKAEVIALYADKRDVHERALRDWVEAADIFVGRSRAIFATVYGDRARPVIAGVLEQLELLAREVEREIEAARRAKS